MIRHVKAAVWIKVSIAQQAQAAKLPLSKAHTFRHILCETLSRPA